MKRIAVLTYVYTCVMFVTLSACQQQVHVSKNESTETKDATQQRVKYPLTVKYVMENGQTGSQTVFDFYPSFEEIKCESETFVLSAEVKQGQFTVLEQEVDDNAFTDFAVEVVDSLKDTKINDAGGYVSVSYVILNESDSLILAEANELHDKESYDLAMQSLENLSEEAQTQACVLYLKGKITNELKAFDESVVYLNKALAVSPKNDNLYYSRAHRYNKLGQVELALKDLEASRAIEPTHYEIYYLYNKIYSDNNDYVNAIKFASLGLAYRDDDYFYNMRGWDYYMNDNLELAHLDFLKALELAPEDANSLEGLAKVFHEQGMYQEAITLIEKATELDGTTTFRLNELGTNHDELGQFADAQRLYHQAIDSGAPNSTTYNNLGWMFLHRKQFKEAIQIYENAIAVGMESEIILNNLGTAYFHDKQFKQSIASFKKVIDSETEEDSNAFSYAGMAHGQIKLEQLDEALRNVKVVIDKDAEYVDATHEKWGIESSAIELLMASLERSADNEGREDILSELVILKERLK